MNRWWKTNQIASNSQASSADGVRAGTWTLATQAVWENQGRSENPRHPFNDSFTYFYMYFYIFICWFISVLSCVVVYLYSICNKNKNKKSNQNDDINMSVYICIHTVYIYIYIYICIHNIWQVKGMQSWEWCDIIRMYGYMYLFSIIMMVVIAFFVSNMFTM